MKIKAQTECGYCGSKNSAIRFNRGRQARIACRACGHEAPDVSHSHLTNNDSNISYSNKNYTQKF